MQAARIDGARHRSHDCETLHAPLQSHHDEMMNTNRIPVTLASLLALGTTMGLSASATASAPDYQVQVRDHSANGNAFAFDDCQQISVDVGGSESASHSGGGAPTTSNTVWAGYWAYNWCTGEQTSGWTSLEGGFGGDMQGASIDLEFEADTYQWAEIEGEWVYTYVGTQTIEVNAELTGVGKAVHGMNNSVSRWGSSFSRYRWVGSWREATVEMSVTVEGVSVELTDAWGNLGKANSGSLAIYDS